ncbi:MAG TPA: coproporphyrinogen III oxidase, partial [Prolixibacteraceae bacterium]|nr:coproporphyrinogen III oxidase [Prolixibacteraceae bacterium]
VSTDKIKETVVFEVQAFEGFVNDELVIFDAESVEVSEKGKFFVRNIAAAFDPNLKNALQKFSKAL